MVQNGEAEKSPRIIITFNGADANIQALDEVSAGQIFLAAYLLDLWAHEVRSDMIAAGRAKQKALLVPFGSAADHALGRQS